MVQRDVQTVVCRKTREEKRGGRGGGLILSLLLHYGQQPSKLVRLVVTFHLSLVNDVLATICTTDNTKQALKHLNAHNLTTNPTNCLDTPQQLLK